MKQVFNVTALAVACVLGLASNASAQETITWSASVPMYDGETVQTFVNTNGTSIYAANMDARTDQPASITLNGVEFTTTNIAGLATHTGVGGVTMSTTMPSETGTSYQDGSFNADGDIFNVIATGMFDVGDITFSGPDGGTNL